MINLNKNKSKMYQRKKLNYTKELYLIKKKKQKSIGKIGTFEKILYRNKKKHPTFVKANFSFP